MSLGQIVRHPNWPKPFKKGTKKYEGNAGSLRILSRYVTLVLASYLQESLVEKCLILLHELSEIITAPKLSLYNIEVTMNRIVKSYLDARIKAIETMNMPAIRPKHHLISHYPEAYKKTGPLINVWGMRMESKHTYFKNVVRSSKNFKNVPLTCASRHQFAQVGYSYQGLFNTHKVIQNYFKEAASRRF